MPFVPKDQEAWLREQPSSGTFWFIIWFIIWKHALESLASAIKSSLRKCYTSPLHNSSAAAGQQSPTNPSEMLLYQCPEAEIWTHSGNRVSFHITRKTISVDLDGLLTPTADLELQSIGHRPTSCGPYGSLRGQ